MHWKTFEALRREYRLIECKTYLEMNKTMPLFGLGAIQLLKDEIAEIEQGRD